MVKRGNQMALQKIMLQKCHYISKKVMLLKKRFIGSCIKNINVTALLLDFQKVVKN